MMNFEVAIAGIAGTLAMTVFTELIAYGAKKPFHVVSILARMLRFRKDLRPISGTRYVVALIIHYSIGVLFSYGFEWFITNNRADMNLSNAIIFGGVVGLIGIIGWRIFFAIHPNPPEIILPPYLTTIWVGHIIFSVVLFYSYLKLLPALAQAFLST
jgi:hypothetical protein